MNSIVGRVLLRLAAFLIVTGWSAISLAASGYVAGTLAFHNMQGNYCPWNTPGYDCTGARFTSFQYDVDLPLPEVQVQVVSASDSGTVYGQGVADASGRYSISWYVPPDQWSVSQSGRILWKYRQKDLRFEVDSAAGSIRYATGSSFTLTANTTSYSPQQLPLYVAGSSSSPSYSANLYSGAWRMWHYGLSTSNLMLSYFAGLKIQGPDYASCPSSMALWPDNVICIDSNGAMLEPQHRVMHEMGHIAHDVAQSHVPLLAYGFPEHCVNNGCANNSWNAWTPEWLSAAFQEGLATFLADGALYTSSATFPLSCLSATYCPADYIYQIETSPGALYCGTDQYRWPLSVERFLWDVYDNVNDGGWDAVSVSYSSFLDTLHAYSAGYGTYQANEPWIDGDTTTNCTGTACDAYVDIWDGAGPVSFAANLFYSQGILPNSQLTNNCAPP